MSPQRWKACEDRRLARRSWRWFTKPQLHPSITKSGFWRECTAVEFVFADWRTGFTAKPLTMGPTVLL